MDIALDIGMSDFDLERCVAVFRGSGENSAVIVL